MAPAPSSQLPTPSSPLSEPPTPSSQLPASTTNNQELITINQLAEQLVKRNPRSLPHRTLLALARLRQNRPADALAVYENVQVAPGALSPSALAVHAAVLAANGQVDDAKTEASQLTKQPLLPEERVLISGL